MSTPDEFPFLLAAGSHKTTDADCCLVELASIQPLGSVAQNITDLVIPAPGLVRDDHDPTVDVARAAFARSLNDSYPQTDVGRHDLTRDNWRTACALKGTVTRNDANVVAGRLIIRSFRDWWPPALQLHANALRDDGGGNAVAAAATIDNVIAKMSSIRQPDLSSSAAISALAGLAAIAARDAIAALDDRADRAARAARSSLAAIDAIDDRSTRTALASLGVLAAIADRSARADMDARAARAALAAIASLASTADTSALASIAARAGLAATDPTIGKGIRSDMAQALFQACS